MKVLTGITVRHDWVMDRAHAIEIADRLRQLRDASRETERRITNRMIAKQAGVAERTVAGWLSEENPKPMSYEHAIACAEVFHGHPVEDVLGVEVDATWLWNGRSKGPTPDLMNQMNGSISEQLASIQEGVTQLLELVAPIAGAQAAADAPQPKPQRRSRSARELPAKPRKRRVANGPAG